MAHASVDFPDSRRPYTSSLKGTDESYQGTFYQCMAREVFGAPILDHDTRNAVLDHYLRGYLGSFGDQVIVDYRTKSQMQYSLDGTTFIEALKSPDVYLYFTTLENISFREAVLQVICNALERCITIYKTVDKYPQRIISATPWSQPMQHPRCDVLMCRFNNGMHGFLNVIECGSGRTLMNYMQTQKAENTNLQIRELNAGDQNEIFRQRLTRNKDILPVYTISITEPKEIGPALNLLEEVLDRAPCQRLPVPLDTTDTTNGNWWSRCRRLKRYVTMDAEYETVSLPKSLCDKVKSGRNRNLCEWIKSHYSKMSNKRNEDFQNFEKPQDGTWVHSEAGPSQSRGDPVGEDILRGSEEQLCSVLTVAIDRHVFFSFFILHMLQNPAPDTVPALERLYERTIFNTGLVKIWWNYCQDFSSLDATIAHMYQGTNRARFRRRSLYTLPGMVQPTWKLSSSHFGGQRPQNLRFGNENDVNPNCPFHDNKPGGEYPNDLPVNETGISCPCNLANIDMATLLDYLNYQLGFKVPGGRNNPPREGRELNDPRRRWYEAPYRYNYGFLLKWTMSENRLFPLLSYLKDAPFRGSLPPTNQHIDRSLPRQPFRDPVTNRKPDYSAWYNAMKPSLPGRPGIERCDDMIGYNIGDVAGIALLMRALIMSDDKYQFLSRLANYGAGNYCEDRQEEWGVNHWKTEGNVTSNVRQFLRHGRTRRAAHDDNPKKRVFSKMTVASQVDCYPNHLEDQNVRDQRYRRMAEQRCFNNTYICNVYNGPFHALNGFKWPDRLPYVESNIKIREARELAVNKKIRTQLPDGTGGLRDYGEGEAARKSGEYTIFNPTRFVLPDIMTEVDDRSRPLGWDPHPPDWITKTEDLNELILSNERNSDVLRNLPGLQNIYAKIPGPLTVVDEMAENTDPVWLLHPSQTPEGDGRGIDPAIWSYRCEIRELWEQSQRNFTHTVPEPWYGELALPPFADDYRYHLQRLVDLYQYPPEPSPPEDLLYFLMKHKFQVASSAAPPT
ncbi:MAG: hypothetical protein M1834_003930 [Cirrosporium novae-zelandiae]|nr:MAG: hypothetical protein M1834_003930 [Cirrosporium novae-zelandiae]